MRFSDRGRQRRGFCQVLINQCNLLTFWSRQSIPTVEPVVGRPMWATHPRAASLNSMLFVSQLSIDSGSCRPRPNRSLLTEILTSCVGHRYDRILRTREAGRGGQKMSRHLEVVAQEQHCIASHHGRSRKLQGTSLTVTLSPDFAKLTLVD